MNLKITLREGLVAAVLGYSALFSSSANADPASECKSGNAEYVRKTLQIPTHASRFKASPLYGEYVYNEGDKAKLKVLNGLLQGDAVKQIERLKKGGYKVNLTAVEPSPIAIESILKYADLIGAETGVGKKDCVVTHQELDVAQDRIVYLLLLKKK
ncbi:MAG: hypothetical protein WC595_02260 [Candidatus Nanoarchaeia archaeon]